MTNYEHLAFVSTAFGLIMVFLFVCLLNRFVKLQTQSKPETEAELNALTSKHIEAITTEALKLLFVRHSTELQYEGACENGPQHIDSLIEQELIDDVVACMVGDDLGCGDYDTWPYEDTSFYKLRAAFKSMYSRFPADLQKRFADLAKAMEAEHGEIKQQLCDICLKPESDAMHDTEYTARYHHNFTVVEIKPHEDGSFLP